MLLQTIKIALLFLFLTAISYSDIRDTLESGSSDSTILISLKDSPDIIVIGFEQLDTNGTAVGGFPDSVKIFARLLDGNWMPVDFVQSVGDSLRSIVWFSAALKQSHTTGQVRIGWIYLPAATDILIQMANAKYLTNRRILTTWYPLYHNSR